MTNPPRIAVAQLPYPLFAVETIHLGDVMKSFFPGQKIAFVSTDPPMNQTLQFLQATACPKADVRIFKEVSQAESWLAIHLQETDLSS